MERSVRIIPAYDEAPRIRGVLERVAESDTGVLAVFLAVAVGAIWKPAA